MCLWPVRYIFIMSVYCLFPLFPQSICLFYYRCGNGNFTAMHLKKVIIGNSLLYSVWYYSFYEDGRPLLFRLYCLIVGGWLTETKGYKFITIYSLRHNIVLDKYWLWSIFALKGVRYIYRPTTVFLVIFCLFVYLCIYIFAWDGSTEELSIDWKGVMANNYWKERKRYYVQRIR